MNVDLGKPAVITENGTSGDASTPGFIVDNLQAVASAMAAGADVRGYFYWTLTDNYEWNHGMDIRMGLYAVSKDDPAKTRTARPAASVYGQIAATHMLSRALLDQWPSDAGLGH